MSEIPQGPGWWEASDGKWYPPDKNPEPGWFQASDGKWYPPQPLGPLQQPYAQPGASANRTGIALLALLLGCLTAIIGLGSLAQGPYFLVFTGIPLLILGVIGVSVGLGGTVVATKGVAARRGGPERAMALTGAVLSGTGVVLGIIGLVLIVIVVRELDESREDPGGVDATADVEITSCQVDPSRVPQVEVEVTNSSSETSDYFVSIEIDSPSEEFLGSPSMSIEDLEPGQSATRAAEGVGTTASDNVTCAVGVAERISS